MEDIDFRIANIDININNIIGKLNTMKVKNKKNHNLPPFMTQELSKLTERLCRNIRETDVLRSQKTQKELNDENGT